ncbi:MAG: hypothetical protein GTO42_01010 [Candidatus Latescibacteria bacterium]|nr:hypothetical protein [Candidatus Latescibacterota bacterium]
MKPIPMTDEEITRLLFLREEPTFADLAIVFGSTLEDELVRRTRRGIQLYHDKLVPKLLVTGGDINARGLPEAKRMEEIALSLRVPEKDLFVEEQSCTTFENARFSKAVIEKSGLLDQLVTVILVSSEWHMRRVLLTMKKIFPERLKFICCPPLGGCTSEAWTQSAPCRQRVLEELTLFQTFRETGAL